MAAALVLISTAPDCRLGVIRRRVRRQVVRGRREDTPLLGDPGLEGGCADNVAGVEHVAVPDAAQLRAADAEGLLLGRLDEHDVVDAGVGVGLDASWKAQNEWITSSEVTCNSTVVSTGSTRCGV